MNGALTKVLQRVFNPVVSRLLRQQQQMRLDQFAELGPVPGAVVFLGDSITEWGLWDEWFPEVTTSNRGISGDRIADLTARLDSALSAPTAVFLMVGTNDLSATGNIDTLAARFDDLVRGIRSRAPQAPLTITGVLPRTPAYVDDILALNRRIAAIADRHCAHYLDLWPDLATYDGALKAEDTRDGLHLSGAGYRAWIQRLRPRVPTTKLTDHDLAAGPRPSGSDEPGGEAGADVPPACPAG
jgi:lysophospholipase L1-like esterase